MWSFCQLIIFKALVHLNTLNLCIRTAPGVSIILYLLIALSAFLAGVIVPTASSAETAAMSTIASMLLAQLEPHVTILRTDTNVSSLIKYYINLYLTNSYETYLFKQAFM